MLLVPFLGIEVKGSKRWLDLIFLPRFQPVEIIKPFFIALGIYFVLKPGADKLSENNFPVFLSYLTMLLLFILIITSAAFMAWSQVQGLVEDEERQDEYDQKLENKWYYRIS